MSVQITPQQEQVINQFVEAGAYDSPAEALDRALQLLQEAEADTERKKAKVRAMIQEGIDSGTAEYVDMEDIIAEAKAERAAKRAAAGE